MTNKEKYYDELMDYALAGLDIAIDKNTNEIVHCKGFKCSDCKFGEYWDVTCCYCKLEWLNEEYIEPEPETDWSKVEVDTPILVRSKEDESWRVRHFAKCENGQAYCWGHGHTSYTAIDSQVYLWLLTKLPTPEELEQYRKKV